MANSTNTFNNFPTDINQFVAHKPTGLTVYQWLTDPINQYRLMGWILGLLYLIDRLCKRDGKSYAFIRSIAAMVNKSERQTQRTLRKLTAIGVITETIEGNQRKYNVNWDLLRTKDTSNYINNNQHSKNADDIINVTPDVTPANFANTVNRIIYPQNHGYTNNTRSSSSNITISTAPYKNTFDNALPLSDTTDFNNIQENPVVTDTPAVEASREEKETVKVATPNSLNHSTKLDPVEIEIKQEFEAISNTKLNLKRDNQALKELKELTAKAKDVVREAFQNVKQHLSETKGKIYSLSYILVTAKNLLHNKSRPEKDNLSEQDRANLSIGGSGSRGVAATPEQLAKDLQNLKIQQENERLRTVLYNGLSDELKDKLIKEEIDVLKTLPTWEQIKPNFSWSYSEHIINIAVDRIKSDLLQVYLDHQTFLTGGQT